MPSLVSPHSFSSDILISRCLVLMQVCHNRPQHIQTWHPHPCLSLQGYSLINIDTWDPSSSANGTSGTSLALLEGLTLAMHARACEIPVPRTHMHMHIPSSAYLSAKTHHRIAWCTPFLEPLPACAYMSIPHTSSFYFRIAALLFGSLKIRSNLVQTQTRPEPRSRFRFAVLPGPDLEVWSRFGPETAEPKPDQTLASLLCPKNMWYISCTILYSLHVVHV